MSWIRSRWVRMAALAAAAAAIIVPVTAGPGGRPAQEAGTTPPPRSPGAMSPSSTSPSPSAMMASPEGSHGPDDDQRTPPAAAPALPAGTPRIVVTSPLGADGGDDIIVLGSPNADSPRGLIEARDGATGTVLWRGIPDVASDPYLIGRGDVAGDARDEVFLGFQTDEGPVTQARRPEDGTVLWSVDRTAQRVWSDLTGDGRPDLIAVTEGWPGEAWVVDGTTGKLATHISAPIGASQSLLYPVHQARGVGGFLRLTTNRSSGTVTMIDGAGEERWTRTLDRKYADGFSTDVFLSRKRKAAIFLSPVLLLSAQDGHTLWSRDGSVPWPPIEGAPLATDVDGDGIDDIPVRRWKAGETIEMLSGADGSVLWTREVGGYEQSSRPAFVSLNDDDVLDIVFRVIDGSWVDDEPTQEALVGIDGRTGRILWRRKDVDILGVPGGDHPDWEARVLPPDRLLPRREDSQYVDLDLDGITDLWRPTRATHYSFDGDGHAGVDIQDDIDSDSFRIQIVSGRTRSPMFSFYGTSMSSAVNMTALDVDGDGRDEILTKIFRSFSRDRWRIKLVGRDGLNWKAE